MRRSQWVVTLVPILIGLVTNIASGVLPPSPWLALAWPVLCALWLVWTVIDYRHTRAGDRERPAPAAGEAQVNEAVIALHEAVYQQWTGEARIRGLSPAEPLPLRWTAKRLPGFPPLADVVAAPPVRGQPRLIGLHGGTAELVRTFLSLRHRQLTVLGAPGAGKSATALLFALHLLHLREQDHTLPVPVLLSLSSWRPHEEHLHAWVTRRLAEEYPALGDTERFGADVAAKLLAGGLIVPVLDALDELPASWHATAVTSIDKAVGTRFPVMVTCRSDSYRTIVHNHHVVSSTTLVVEIDEVRTADAVRFLSQGRSTGDPGWQSLFTDLDRQPHGALARALRTPLTVALLNSAHPPGGGGDPRALLVHDDPADIEKHLLETFVSAAYSRPGPLPPGARPARRSPIPASSAQCWLTTFAEHLAERQDYEIRWWRVHEMVPARPLRLFAGLLVGASTSLALAAATWLIAGALDGGGRSAALLVGLLGGALLGGYVAVADAPPDQPSRLHLRGASPTADHRPRGVARRFGATVRGGLNAGLATGLVAQATYSVAFGVFDTGALALMLGLMFGVVTGLALGISGWLGRPADCVEGPAPLALLRSDRAFTLLRLTLFAAIFGVAAGVAAGSVAGPDVGLRDGLAAALLGAVVALTRGLGAWGWFVLARTWLAVRRRTPWRLLTFLDDAHSRGVLRRAGGVYEFRHSTLRDQLAGVPAASAPEADPAPETVPTTRRQSRSALRARLATVPVAAVVTLVAGMFLGAGLPVVASPQADCGGLFDNDVRLLRDGFTSECVGVTDGSVVFDQALSEVQHRIHAENRQVAKHERQYVQVALLMPLTAAPGAPSEIDRIRRSLEGAYLAQRDVNASAGAVAVQLILAHGGSRQAQWQPIVRQLADRADDSHPLVAVIGLGSATARTIVAAEHLRAAGIPLVAATMTADYRGFAAAPGVASATGSSTDAVGDLLRILDQSGARRSPVVVIGDTDTDPYARASLEVLHRYVEQLPEVFTVVPRGSSHGREASYDNVGGTVCSARASHVIYTGRPAGLPTLLRALSRRLCRPRSLTVLTTALTLPAAGLSDAELTAAGLHLIVRTQADVSGRVTRRDIGPGALPDLVRSHGYFFGKRADAFSDGSAVLHHDALKIAVTAIEFVAAADRRLTAREVLRELSKAQVSFDAQVRRPRFGPFAGAIMVQCLPRERECPSLPPAPVR